MAVKAVVDKRVGVVRFSGDSNGQPERMWNIAQPPSRDELHLVMRAISAMTEEVEQKLNELRWLAVDIHWALDFHTEKEGVIKGNQLSALWTVVFGSEDPDEYIMSWAILFEAGVVNELPVEQRKIGLSLLECGALSQRGMIQWSAWESSALHKIMYSKAGQGE